MEGPLPSRFATLVDALRWWAETTPERDAVAFLADGETETARLTYAELDREARRVAASLQRIVDPGDRALLCFPPGLDFVVAFLGCLYARVIAVPVYPPRVARQLGRLAAVVADSEARIALTTAETVRDLKGGGGLAVPWVVVEPIGSGGPTRWSAPEVAPSDVAFLQYTSGSTSSPKGVVVANENLAANLEMLGGALELSDATICVSWLPVYHDMGLIGCVLMPLWVGAFTALMPPVAFVQKPARWLRAITRYRATFAVAPNFAWELCTQRVDAADATLDLSSVRVACNGAEPIREDTLENFSRRFAPRGFRREAFCPVYGMAEVTLYASGHHLGPQAGMVVDRASLQQGVAAPAAQEANALTVVSCGVSPPGQSLAIVDPESLRECAPGQVGEIWLSGPHIARGYWNNPEVTAATFQAKLRTRGGSPFLRTGDLGFVHGGDLFVTGRLKDLIIVLGRNHYPQDIEGTAERAHRAVRAGCSAAFALARDGSDGVGVVAEIPGGCSAEEHAAIAAAIIGAVWDEHEVSVFQLALVKPRGLPKTSSGKVRRRHTRDLLLGNELEACYRWPPTAPAIAPVAVARELAPPVRTDASVAFAPPQGDVEPHVAAVWSEVLGVGPVGRAHSFFGLGGDSLRGARVVEALAARGITGATLADLFNAPVLADFARGLGIASRSDRDGGAVILGDPEHRYDLFPATAVQQAYWLGRNPAFTLGGVGSHWYAEYDGVDVDLGRLEAAWNRLVARHDMLRAVLAGDGEQLVLAEVPAYRIAVADVAPNRLEGAHAEMRAAMSHQVLDLACWPLFDIRAVRCGARTRIAFSFDYIVVDALSIMTVLGELSALYENPDAALPPLVLSFRDCVLAMRADGDAVARDERYWSERIDRLPPPPQLPLRVDPALVKSPTFTRRSRTLDRGTWGTLVSRARARDLTPSVVLATAFAEVLAAWSGREHLTINLTLFDRRGAHPDIDRVVGEFTSLLLVAYEPEPDESWAQRARRLQQQMARDLEHRAVSAVWVMREMARRAGAAEVPMPVVFTSTLGVLDDRLARTTGFGQQVWGVSQTPQVWLDHQVAQHDGGLLFQWDVVEELFPDGVIDAMLTAFLGTLARLAAPDADWDVWDVPPPPLLPAEQAVVRDVRNDTRGSLPEGTLGAEFFARAAEAPHRAALLWGDDDQMSYGTLSESARRVAALLREAGVVAGDLVAITLPRGPEQIVAVLGILAAGAVYVPIGVEQPAQRRARIHARAGIRHVLTSQALRRTLDWPAGARILDLDSAAAVTPIEAPVAVSPDELAYVIFTSGSTGEPKGVMVSHRAALNTIVDVTARYGIGRDDRVLAVSALDFDLSVYDVFGLLGAGGALVLLGDDDTRDAFRWRDLVRRRNVTVWNSVPALLDMLLLAGDGGEVASLRVAMVSGDWVGLDLPARLTAQVPACRLISLGGATEAAIWSNAFEVGKVPAHWRSIPYGYPLRNQKFRVVGPRGHDCPAWVPGELWIGGAGVAAGYRGDPETTARQFVLYRGERWYRTGDLGRYWADGTLEILGRLDSQVKIRGHRIELGEIEAALEGDGDVVSAVVVPVTSGGRAARLAAFVVTRSEALDDAHLRAVLTARVPPHWMPSSFHRLDLLPLTANGKVDRAALARRAEAEGEPAPTEPPRGTLEEALAGIWREVLGVDGLGRGDNFVALGGDSVLATKVVTHVRARLDIQMSLRELFAAPTVASLAAVLSDRHLEEEGRI